MQPKSNTNMGAHIQVENNHAKQDYICKIVPEIKIFEFKAIKKDY